MHLAESHNSSRRGVLALLVLSPAALWLARGPSAHAATKLQIHPREDWADGLEPRGPMPSEHHGDVRFLLVHHTETANGYAQADVPGQLRGFYRYHTTTKGWNDIAYNYLVDAYGGVWEGRKGSLQGPVRGDATGGSQGFDQLACFIGDHQSVPPTAAAQASMVLLLAHLATRYRITTGPDAMTTFTSRGSNRYPKGSTITAHTISGHRDLSMTTCPGNAAYALLPSWRGRVHRLAPLSVHPAAARATSAPAPTTAPVPASAPASLSAATTAAQTSSPAAAAATGPKHTGTPTKDELVGGIAAASVATLLGLAALARRAATRGRG